MLKVFGSLQFVCIFSDSYADFEANPSPSPMNDT